MNPNIVQYLLHKITTLYKYTASDLPNYQSIMIAINNFGIKQYTSTEDIDRAYNSIMQELNKSYKLYVHVISEKFSLNILGINYNLPFSDFQNQLYNYVIASKYEPQIDEIIAISQQKNPNLSGDIFTRFKDEWIAELKEDNFQHEKEIYNRYIHRLNAISLPQENDNYHDNYLSELYIRLSPLKNNDPLFGYINIKDQTITISGVTCDGSYIILELSIDDFQNNYQPLSQFLKTSSFIGEKVIYDPNQIALYSNGVITITISSNDGSLQVRKLTLYLNGYLSSHEPKKKSPH